MEFMKKMIVAALIVASVSGCAAVQNDDRTTKKLQPMAAPSPVR